MKVKNIDLAEYYSLSRQTIASYKKTKIRLYNAMVLYYLKESLRKVSDE